MAAGGIGVACQVQVYVLQGRGEGSAALMSRRREVGRESAKVRVGPGAEGQKLERGVGGQCSLAGGWLLTASSRPPERWLVWAPSPVRVLREATDQ